MHTLGQVIRNPSFKKEQPITGFTHVVHCTSIVHCCFLLLMSKNADGGGNRGSGGRRRWGMKQRQMEGYDARSNDEEKRLVGITEHQRNDVL